MTDPTEVINSLHAHVQARLGIAINNGPLHSSQVRPGAADFAITAVREGPGTASGGTRMSSYVDGYFATHHSPATLPAALVAIAANTARAMNTWWGQPIPQAEPGLLSWNVDAGNMFLNSLINSPGGPAVLTVETGFTLLLELEVS